MIRKMPPPPPGEPESIAQYMIERSHKVRGTVYGDSAGEVHLAARRAAVQYFGHGDFTLTWIVANPFTQVQEGEVLSWEGRWEAVARMEGT